MVSRILILLGCFAVGGLGSAQSVDTERFSISGAVTNKVTGEPIRRSLVTLQRQGARSKAGPGWWVQRAFSDAAGQFSFTGLEVGDYQVSAAKPQFEPLRLPGVIAVGPSQNNLELKLDPYSSIEGTVVDTEGAPMQFASVEAVRARVQDGRTQYLEARTVATDDRGHFRMWNLGPGRYYLRLSGRYGGTRGYLGESTPLVDWPEVVAPVYYGHVTERAAATPFQISSGQQVTADFKEPLQPAYKVRGVLSNFRPHEKTQLQLLTPDGQKVAARIAVNSANGRFEANDVTAGDYRLAATQGEGDNITRAEAGFRMVNAALEGVRLVLEPGADVTVTTRCDDTREGNGLRACGADLQLASSLGTETIHAQYTEGGRAAFRNVPAGEYELSARAFMGYVASANMGSTALTWTSKLVIRPGVRPDPIELGVRDDSGQVECSLDFDMTMPGIGLLAVPEFESMQAPVALRMEGGGGNWTFGALAPGDYTIYAVPNLDQLAYREPQVRRALTNGVRVRVAAKETAHARLTGVAR